MSRRSSDRPLRALTWMACSAIGFSLMGVFVKRLGPAVPLFELVFLRSALNFILVATYMLKKREAFLPEPPMHRLLLYRGLAGFAGISCLFYSLKHLPLPIASMLGWSSPLFVVLFSRLILGEKISIKGAVCMAIAFFGLVLLIKPDMHSGWSALPINGVFVGLLGAACSGSAYLAVRAATAKVGVNLIVLYFMAVASLISAPFAYFDFRLPTLAQGIEILLLGVAAGVGQLTMTRGYHYAPAGEVSAMSLLNAAFSAILGWLLFEERLALLQWLGMLVMAFAIAFLTWSSKNSEQGASRVKLRYE